MRRIDREIKDIAKIHEIIENCHCCRLGFYDDGEIYIVPMNFGYKQFENETVLYFHSAFKGRKIDLIKKLNRVGFEMDTNFNMYAKNENEPCSYSASFESIIGTGEVFIINDDEEKKFALQAFMLHTTKKGDWNFSKNILDSVCMFKMKITKMSCKIHE